MAENVGQLKVTLNEMTILFLNCNFERYILWLSNAFTS